uniref:Uncharacterized protein n=1 Tax=Neobodo designis TaxID=312471 RepID=A0A7S1QFE6_NEODS
MLTFPIFDAIVDHAGNARSAARASLAVSVKSNPHGVLLLFSAVDGQPPRHGQFPNYQRALCEWDRPSPGSGCFLFERIYFLTFFLVPNRMFRHVRRRTVVIVSDQ